MVLKINSMCQNQLDSWVTFLVVIYPLIFGYRSIFPLITFGEVLALITMLYIIVLSKGRIINEKAMICTIVVVVARVSLSFVENVSIADSFGTGMRLAMLYCFILVLKPYFNMKKGKKYIEVVGIIVAIYAFAQIIAAKFGIYLTASLPFLNSIRDVDGEVLQKAMYGIAFRPTSILGEPSELGGYLALPLALNLFDDNRDKGWLKKSVFFSIAIVLTMSSTGIFLFLLEWAIFVFKSKNIKNKNLLVIALIVGGGTVFFASGMWRLFIERTFLSHGGEGLKGILSNTHYKDIAGVYAENNGIFKMLFGNGMSEPPGFLPGVFRLHYYFGIIGIVVFMVWLFDLYRKGNRMQRSLMIVWIMMNVGGAYILGSFALPYILFLGAKDYDCENSFEERYNFCVLNVIRPHVHMME